MPRNFTENFYRPEGTERALAVPGGPGVPWWVVPPLGHPQLLLQPIGCLLVDKNSTKSFAAFGHRLVLIFCDVKSTIG